MSSVASAVDMLQTIVPPAVGSAADCDPSKSLLPTRAQLISFDPPLAPLKWMVPAESAASMIAAPFDAKRQLRKTVGVALMYAAEPVCRAWAPLFL